jgi:hypothetical protein
VAALIAAQRDDHGIPAAVACRAVGVSRSWFYKHQGGTLPPRAARRKGYVYGTVLVDMRTGDVIDLLPDREAASFEAWLKAHPGENHSPSAVAKFAAEPIQVSVTSMKITVRLHDPRGGERHALSLAFSWVAGPLGVPDLLSPLCMQAAVAGGSCLRGRVGGIRAQPKTCQTWRQRSRSHPVWV